ncbi:MAG TPA: hypothetical protein VGN18_04820 [Jatrophihabitans sp.]|jgi:hypothetical protein|uniref:hypothetical protein n=1 Tax=Jatrophihabitans sp. TaxID=1932789 RepID=UPI002E08487D|nr:hypothetical protein [Jatrophihabitans sp.]
MDPSVSPDVATRTELDAVRIRRAELRETLNSLENTLAAPAAGRAVVWGEAVHDVLLTVAGDFGAHVEVTEGPHGLHQSILGGDLRLANAVGALTAEHAQIAEEIAMLVADSSPPVAPADVAELRERATRLLGHLVRHRQRGADLVYEAYQTDIGGGD